MNTSCNHTPSRTQILRRFLGVFTLFVIATLAACGGSGGGGGNGDGAPGQIDAAITTQPASQSVVAGSAVHTHVACKSYDMDLVFRTTARTLASVIERGNYE